ncbi:MAG: ABC transporter ATP-binding protein [Armatimonadota bacterium]|nr:ABC transporter ATP-binding protein [Armatimonadota bacterium]
MLRLNNVEVRYHEVILALKGISLEVPAGGIVALLGANGAGKSTTLKAISGLLRHENGAITEGAIEFAGERIDRRSAEEISQAGIVQVLEGRRVFPHLTVEQNLLVGAHRLGNGQAVRRGLEMVYHYFPRLQERRRVPAGYISGGEQQMTVIGRALMATPRLLLLDEPSMGLAPLLIKEMFEIVSRLNREQGIPILLVEQNAKVALNVADHAYVLENGRMVMEGPSEQLRENPDIRDFYLGLTDLGTRKSFRQVKFYKRRKRWIS